MTAMELAKESAKILNNKKALDIKVIGIEDISVLADYFVIANGSNDSQVRALVENVDEKMQKAGFTMKQQEGKGGAWVLMDYGDVIVHVFDKENRLFYNLERIWSDGIVVEEL